MSRYRLVIFDFDGTLADSSTWFRGALREMGYKHGFRQVDDAEIERLRGLGTREIIDALGIKMWQLPALGRDFRALATAAAASISLFPGVVELLERLAEAKIATAVVSSNAESTVRAVLGAQQGRIVHYACGSSLFGKARKLTKVLRILKVPSSAVLCVGDESRDVEAARTAGLQCAAVTWGYATEAALRRAAPDFVLSSVEELRALTG